MHLKHTYIHTFQDDELRGNKTMIWQANLNITPEQVRNIPAHIFKAFEDPHDRMALLHVANFIVVNNIKREAAFDLISWKTSSVAMFGRLLSMIQQNLSHNDYNDPEQLAWSRFSYHVKSGQGEFHNIQIIYVLDIHTFI